ncbi:MAG: GNAT family N-acetyltransferase [Armatimonadetes bacterium]|nr:GNAT family N-acetyltransferase [Armatimonadota bacterium]
MVILETERLTLRQWEPDEFPTVHRILGHAVTMRFWPAPFTPEQSESWLQRSLVTYAATANTLGRWATVLKESGEVIGDCGLIQAHINGMPEYDLGYIIQAEHWRKGYGTEAAAAIRDYGFSELKLPRIVANMACNHHGSARVAEAIGMQVETTFANQRNRGVQTFLYSMEHP